MLGGGLPVALQNRIVPLPSKTNFGDWVINTLGRSTNVIQCIKFTQFYEYPIQTKHADHYEEEGVHYLRREKILGRRVKVEGVV